MKLNTKTTNASNTIETFLHYGHCSGFLSLRFYVWRAFDDDIDDGDDNGDDDDDLNGLLLSMFLRVKRVWDSHWPENLVLSK